jgi:hypothetical protein
MAMGYDIFHNGTLVLFQKALGFHQQHTERAMSGATSMRLGGK